MTTLSPSRARPAPRHTLGSHVARFFERRLRHVAGPLARRPLVLEPWQREDLDLIYEVDGQGRRVWHEVLWGQARGNGKTPTLGGIALLELVSWSDAPRVFAAAGARDQARLLLDFCRPNVEQGPLADHLVPRANAILDPRHDGVLRILSADGDLQHGLNVSFAGLDELHVFKTEKQRELYFALATALKRPHSWEASITTAGWSRHTLLGQRHEAMTKKAERVWVSDDGCLTIAMDRAAGRLMIWRGLPEGADPGDEELWRAVNPASWVTLDYLRRQAKRLPAGVFRRLHLNEWIEAENSAISAALWDGCRDPERARIEPGTPITVAVATSEQVDQAAIAVLGDPVREVRPLRVEILLPESEGVWASVAPRVGARIRELAAEHQLARVALNPVHLGRLQDELAGEGIPVYQADNAQRAGFWETDAFMIPASQRLQEALSERRLAHDAPPEVRGQVLAAEARISRDAWRIVRPRAHVGLETPAAEAGIAVAMAVEAAESHAGTPYLFIA